MSDLFNEVDATTTSLDLRRLQRQKRREKRRVVTAVLSVVGLVLFAIGGSIAWNFVKGFQSEKTQIADYEGYGQGHAKIIIEQGDSGRTIARKLEEAGVIASAEAFVKLATESSENANMMQSLSAGHYRLQREMRAQYALEALSDKNNRDLRTITVIEGRRLATYYEAIANVTGFTVAEVEAAAADTDGIGLPAQANGNIEGWLFPAKYEFNPGVTPKEVLTAMVKKTVEILQKHGVAPEDQERILTIASLIEREAMLPDDRYQVSGVIQNRLAINKQLEFDSTIKYFAPSEGVTTTAEQRAIDNPYNTYMYAGLPPGPIAAPGEAAIVAALNPAEHNYLFFVSVDQDTGETLYAETFAEHQQNVKIWQENMRKAQEGSD